MKTDKHILVVEDDVELCNAMLSTLHRNGYKVVGATDVREATFKLKNQKYNCILLDMRLGVDSGVELVDFIRERKDAQNTETPIMVVSGHLDRDIVEKVGKRIQGAMVKPFDMNVLLENLKKIVG
jgi:DNA-binding response OmpR family regulator